MRERLKGHEEKRVKLKKEKEKEKRKGGIIHSQNQFKEGRKEEEEEEEF